MSHKKTIFPNWMVRLFANNAYFHLLKTTSRLIALSAYFLSFYVSEHTYIHLCVLAVTLLSMDVLFQLIGWKESQFKSNKFFERNDVTPKIMDRYNRSMTVTKILLMIPALCMIVPAIFMIIPAVFIIALPLYGIACLPMAFIIAHSVKFRPFMLQPKPILLLNQDPWYYGLPGFGVAGNWTGNSSSVGGMAG